MSTPDPAEDPLRRWVETWRTAGEALRQVRLEELRDLDQDRAIALLTGDTDPTREPWAPRPWSGLVEQQAWFRKARPDA